MPNIPDRENECEAVFIVNLIDTIPDDKLHSLIDLQIEIGVLFDGDEEDQQYSKFEKKAIEYNFKRRFIEMGSEINFHKITR